MPTSIAELVDRATADAGLAAVLDAGDWYLVGSRMRGLQDDLSDWDTVLLTRDDPRTEQRAVVRAANLDRIFGVTRPTGAPDDVEFHRAYRRAAAVEISIFGPAGRAHRAEGGNVIWYSDLAQAIPLRSAPSGGPGEAYRHAMAAEFARELPRLRDDAYLGFRMTRNGAAASLGRGGTEAIAVTVGLCLEKAAQFWLLSVGVAYPASKWLFAQLEREPSAPAMCAEAAVVADGSASDAARFRALWALWELIDGRAAEVGVSDDLFAGSPFLT